MLRAFALTMLMALMVGCSAQQKPNDRMPNDPRDPSAAEAPFAAPSPLALEQAPRGEAATHSMPMTSSPSINASQKTRGSAQVIYTCKMHPQIALDHPGDCPICGMTLIPKGRQK